MMKMRVVALNKSTYQYYEKQIKQFKSERFPKGESFLRYDSHLYLDSCSKFVTYLIVKEDSNKRIVAYFVLSAASIFWATESIHPVSNPCIEIVYFSVNDFYSKYNGVSLRTGQQVFLDFILPTIKKISNHLGVLYIILFSLPVKKVIESYMQMGFNLADNDVAEYIRYYSVKDCKLMVYNLKVKKD